MWYHEFVERPLHVLCVEVEPRHTLLLEVAHSLTGIGLLGLLVELAAQRVLARLSVAEIDSELLAERVVDRLELSQDGILGRIGY